jgi:hypothetical protein
MEEWAPKVRHNPRERLLVCDHEPVLWNISPAAVEKIVEKYGYSDLNHNW